LGYPEGAIGAGKGMNTFVSFEPAHPPGGDGIARMHGEPVYNETALLEGHLDAGQVFFREAPAFIHGPGEGFVPGKVRGLGAQGLGSLRELLHGGPSEWHHRKTTPMQRPITSAKGPFPSSQRRIHPHLHYLSKYL
jgi:hypothetical protein